MLDTVMPWYDCAERHHRRLPVPPGAAWAALTRLTLADLTLTRPLVRLRHAGPAPAGRLLDQGPLTLLVHEPGAYALGGAVARPWLPSAPRHPVATVEQLAAFTAPGWTTYLTEFRVVPDGDGCVLTTETRVRSTSPDARRRFAAYWALIRVPSGVVRRDVLRTVGRLAALL